MFKVEISATQQLFCKHVDNAGPLITAWLRDDRDTWLGSARCGSAPQSLRSGNIIHSAAWSLLEPAGARWSGAERMSAHSATPRHRTTRRDAAQIWAPRLKWVWDPAYRAQPPHDSTQEHGQREGKDGVTPSPPLADCISPFHAWSRAACVGCAPSHGDRQVFFLHERGWERAGRRWAERGGGGCGRMSCILSVCRESQTSRAATVPSQAARVIPHISLSELNPRPAPPRLSPPRPATPPPTPRTAAGNGLNPVRPYPTRD